MIELQHVTLTLQLLVCFMSADTFSGLQMVSFLLGRVLPSQTDILKEQQSTEDRLLFTRTEAMWKWYDPLGSTRLNSSFSSLTKPRRTRISWSSSRSPANYITQADRPQKVFTLTICCPLLSRRNPSWTFFPHWNNQTQQQWLKNGLDSEHRLDSDRRSDDSKELHNHLLHALMWPSSVSMIV